MGAIGVWKWDGVVDCAACKQVWVVVTWGRVNALTGLTYHFVSCGECVSGNFYPLVALCVYAPGRVCTIFSLFSYSSRPSSTLL